MTGKGRMEDICETTIKPSFTSDDYSYFCKYDQLKGIVCNVGGSQYALNESCYVSAKSLYPNECY